MIRNRARGICNIHGPGALWEEVSSRMNGVLLKFNARLRPARASPIASNNLDNDNFAVISELFTIVSSACEGPCVT